MAWTVGGFTLWAARGARMSDERPARQFAGSGLTFSDRGVYTLKGVPDQWQLYAVQ